MDIQCFLCENTYNSTKELFSHIKQHTIAPNVTYKCTFKDCYQQFHRKFPYKRHVLKHFSNKEFDTLTSRQHEMEQCLPPNQSLVPENNMNSTNKECDITLEKPQVFNYKKELSNLYDSASNFVAKLHSLSNFSKTDVNNITKVVEDLILNNVLNFIEQTQDSCKYIEKTFPEVLSDVKLLFNNASSDFKLEKTLYSKNLISDVKCFTIDNDLKSSGIIMPLEFQLKKIFERGNYLEEFLNHIEEIERSPKFVNFVQGKLWKQKKNLYGDKTVIPYFLYADDFGINNPLGSKANKNSMCNFYYSFPCKPEKNSKLDDVFLACSIKSAFVKKYGNKCYEPLIETLKRIEVDGITIKSNGRIKNVHFIMGLFLGDNLGLNIALGFSKSFSATYYCRFCLIHKSVAQTLTCEDGTILRNRSNYRASIESGKLVENGLNTICAFNNIPSFHCTENFAVDIMHDLFEGICHYVITDALVHFIKVMKYISIETLNNRLKVLSYDDHDKGNEKLFISKSELEKRRLKMSAKQMMAFCQYFTIIIGEFIPSEDLIWLFLLNFFELIDDILCYEVSRPLVTQLKMKIERFNNEYQTLFKRKLTPKFHFLLHYATIIKNCGPLRHLWSFKFEAKHKEFKIYSHVITSRKNIAKSFSFKQQMSFLNYFRNENIQEDFVCYKQVIDFELQKKISNKLKIPKQDFSIYLEAKIWGYKYDNKKIVHKYTNDFELFQIFLILKTKLNELIFCCKKIVAVFNEHFTAYEYEKLYDNYTLVRFLEVGGPPTEAVKTTQGKSFVKLKEYYKSIY